MIASVADFVAFFERVRERTDEMLRAVPAESFEWQPKPGQYTCGDIARHLGAAQMTYWGAACGQGWRYPGHGAEHGASKTGALHYLARCHVEATAALRRLPDLALNAKVPDVDGKPTPAWRVLMAGVEHEIHHRGELAAYLTLMGVEPPVLFGAKVENEQGE